MKAAALVALALVVMLGGCTGGADALQTEQCGVYQRPPAHEGAIRTSTAHSTPGICLPSGVRLEDGRARCIMREHVPTDVGGCRGLPGRTFLHVEPSYLGREHELCEIAQAPATSSGWRYLEVSTLPHESVEWMQCRLEGQMIRFSEDVSFAADSTIEWTCHLAEGSHGNAIGSPCADDDAFRCEGAVTFGRDGQTVELTCDDETARCAAVCTSDDDCTAAGFANDVCNARGGCEPGVCRFE